MDSRQQIIIDKTAKFVEAEMQGESSGHDWWHVYRVWHLAKIILESEPKADRYIVELAALLHDLKDWKFEGPEAGPKAVHEWLRKCGESDSVTDSVVSIIRGEISQSGEKLAEAKSRIEYKIVHDADNLDAIGAIGIARAFATGAKFNEVFYDPLVPPPNINSVEEYVNTRGKEGRTVINHFHEKLLKIKNLMQTKEGRTIADQRHNYMENYLEQFLKEWEGEL